MQPDGSEIHHVLLGPGVRAAIDVAAE